MRNKKYKPGSRRFAKTNFVDLVEIYEPNIYTLEDTNLSGVELNPISDIINRHIKAAANIEQVLPVSAISNSLQYSELNNISGIGKFFIKQTEQTKVTPFSFEKNILLPLGKSLVTFDNSSTFCEYLSGTLLPIIVPPTLTNPDPIQSNAGTLSAISNNPDASSIHEKLLDTLGWFYLLNTSADGGLTYSPSSYVLDSLVTLYTGNNLEAVDGVKGFTEYIWKNYATCSLFSNLGLLPSNFVSGASDAITSIVDGSLPTYTSGIQKLEKLKTLVDVIYSPAYIDSKDFTVRDAFNDYINSEIILEDLISKGPLRKLNTILGFEFADLSDKIENLDLIYDIENAKDEHLQYIAQLIGWKLKTRSPERWREQLRIAVDLYKKTGTLDCIQTAIDSLVQNTVFDVSGRVQELWESYVPFIIWYALATESPLFKNLETWTPQLALEAGVGVYNSNSLEESTKAVVDTILLDLYKKYPLNFNFGKTNTSFDPPRLYELDAFGNIVELYTVVGEDLMRPFHAHLVNGPGFEVYKRLAEASGLGVAWEKSKSYGPLGYAVYAAGEEHFNTAQNTFLSATGNLEFVFNYRGRTNYPIPPFEEIKYYKNSILSADFIATLVERLKCFQVKESFADQVGNFLLNATVQSETNLGSLNDFLLLFSSIQVPPNFDDVMLNSSNYQKNLLDLWNGKSSHLFIEFDNTDFDFAKDTLDGDGKYALYEASRVAKEFTPAHAIAQVALNASAEDDYFDISSTKYEYLAFDHDDNLSYYTSASILGNLEVSGHSMVVSPGTDDGRGGLNTFKRGDVDNIFNDALLSSTAAITTAPRRALRRRNYKYTLPREGYYDRTGFNGPLSYNPSSLENSFPNSLGELTLGYVASAGKFFPIEDHLNPSGIWHICEDLNSSRTFSGVDTSATFPYRGLLSLGANAKTPEESAVNAKYSDRCQVPRIYISMHELMMDKALKYAKEQIKLDPSSFVNDAYWKNNAVSYANQAVASGFVLNSFDDYVNFEFGTGMHKLHRDYCKYFGRHPLGANYTEKTGGSIFAHVFGKAMYNCDFDIQGSAVSTELIGSYVCSSYDGTALLNFGEGSGVFSTCAVAEYSDGSQDLPASGTYIASSVGDAVVPLIGTFTEGERYRAEFRNPHILSGIEFCDTSGSPKQNSFKIFKIADTFASVKEENVLIDNTVIKCKAAGGLPRIRFDLSSYGDLSNSLIKDHKFKLGINHLIGQEQSNKLGGGYLGVWIHTQPKNDLMWTWTPNGKWSAHLESNLSREAVLSQLAHKLYFPEYKPQLKGIESKYCLKNTLESTSLSLKNIKKRYFENKFIEFDTRNFTKFNNFEFLDIIPITHEQYQISQQVHTEDTNYIIEIFFVPTNNEKKYLLINDISLQDITLRDYAGLSTGYGIETSGIPNKRFVKEDKLYLDKEQLRDVLQFYNGLMGQRSGVYTTSLASRDATITSGIMDVSGGSRLNYRIHPDWVNNTKDATFNNYTQVELDN